jgi:hypothetical protein
MEIFLSDKPSALFPHLSSPSECCMRKADTTQVSVTEGPYTNARDDHVTSQKHRH